MTVAPTTPIAASRDDACLSATLIDDRVLRAPLQRRPRLLNAGANERAAIEASPMGLHWPEIGEDISAASGPRGRKALGRSEARTRGKVNEVFV